jgi:hypothetical protein
MKTSENLQQCPAGGFFVFGRRTAAFPERIAKPNRQSESIARRHRPQSGWLSRFFDPANRVAPAATHARNGRQATVP